MIDEGKFVDYIRKQGCIIYEEGEEVSIDGVLERFIDEMGEIEEKGKAEIKICLTCGKIKVYHSEGNLLFEKTAKRGDWDKIWKAIKE